MLDWLHTLSTWLQSWATPEMGLWGLFGSAFLSATILPGSSEVVLTALITAYPAQAWPGFAVALAGNLLGCLLTFGMGHAGRQGYERFQKVKVDLDSQQVQRLRRWGPPALVLSILPLVGDALVLAAGWLRMPLAQSLFWIALGKGARYLLVVLAMLGVLKFA
jgi:membrane protein YqaA with SNARE-associated domain